LEFAIYTYQVTPALTVSLVAENLLELRNMLSHLGGKLTEFNGSDIGDCSKSTEMGRQRRFICRVCFYVLSLNDADLVNLWFFGAAIYKALTIKKPANCWVF